MASWGKGCSVCWVSYFLQRRAGGGEPEKALRPEAWFNGQLVGEIVQNDGVLQFARMSLEYAWIYTQYIPLPLFLSFCGRDAHASRTFLYHTLRVLLSQDRFTIFRAEPPSGIASPSLTVT